MSSLGIAARFATRPPFARSCYCQLAKRTFFASQINFEVKPSIANIGEIRKLLPGTTLTKAKEALSKSDNDIQKALLWLEKDAVESGAKKASKLINRQASEGGIAVCTIGDGVTNSSNLNIIPRAGIIELNCETDFVGKNEIFQGLLRDIAHSVAIYPILADKQSLSSDMIDIATQDLLEFPLLSIDGGKSKSAVPKTIGSAILDATSRLGERIHLKRASAVSIRSNRDSSSAKLVTSSFSHGGTSLPQSASSNPSISLSVGKISSLLLTSIQIPEFHLQNPSSMKALQSLIRSLARQSAGMPTTSIKSGEEESLYSQPFILRLASSKLEGEETIDTNASVAETLKRWSKLWTGTRDDKVATNVINVEAMRRWQIGEEIQ